MASKFYAYWRAEPMYQKVLRSIAPCSNDDYYFMEWLSQEYDVYCANDMLEVIPADKDSIKNILLKIAYSGYGYVNLVREVSF